MTGLWRAEQAELATGGEARGDWTATGVSIDSRTLAPGDLFVALTDQRDGHDFVAQALAGGAAAAMVSRIPEGVAEDAPLLIVEDVLEALRALARAARARSAARVVAVTGSVGKTSTKEMLRGILAGQCQDAPRPEDADHDAGRDADQHTDHDADHDAGHPRRRCRVHAAEASFNNHWGVPLTLARLPADADFAVIEIGMNHPGEIAPLSRLARPHVALITTVVAAHMAAFDTLEDIAREKAAIFEGLEPGGAAVFPDDLPVSPVLHRAAYAAGAEAITFGAAPGAHLCCLQARPGPEATVVRASHRENEFLFKLMTPGAHFAANALGALGVVDALGGDVAVAAADLARWQPPPGRGARETIVLDVVDDHLTLSLIDDAYNANPASMAAALAVLAASEPADGVGRIARGRRVAILGDMLELGDSEAEDHRALAGLPAMAAVDLVHCAGPRMRALYDALPESRRGEWHETAEPLAARAHSLVDAGDTILVKGSKGSRVSLVVEAIRKLGRAAPADTKDAT